MKTPSEKEVRSAELYKQGASVSAIARTLATSTTRVSLWLEKAGLRRLEMREDPERDARVVKLYAAGNSLAEITKQCGVTASLVIVLARRAGLPERKKGSRFTEIEPSKRRQIVKSWNGGKPAQVIADEIGLHVGLVKRVLREEGIGYEPRRHGDKTGRWHRGEWRRMDHGYVRIQLLPTDQFFGMADSTGYVLEHRYVMAQKLGRALTDDETVHHKDNDPLNNKRSNLQLRKGRHGKHACFQCADCGSRNIVSVRL